MQLISEEVVTQARSNFPFCLCLRRMGVQDMAEQECLVKLSHKFCMQTALTAFFKHTLLIFFASLLLHWTSLVVKFIILFYTSSLRQNSRWQQQNSWLTSLQHEAYSGPIARHLFCHSEWHFLVNSWCYFKHFSARGCERQNRGGYL